MLLSYSFALVALFGTSCVVADDKLVLASVLYRHGARSPTRFFPTNPNQVDSWPDGPGRLTQVGMKMEYELGKFFKARYVDSTNGTRLINETYLHNEVYIRSSSIDRCLQSAQSQLAGLYPPKGYQVWNHNISWQPIPVQTVPGGIDDLLRPSDADCPRIGEMWKDMKKHDKYKKMEFDNKEFLDNMTKWSGQTIQLENIWDVTDDILCEQAEGKTSAPWAIENLPEILKLSNWVFSYMYEGTDELGRLLGGAVLGEMISNMQGIIEDDPKKVIHKLNIYSGHDTSVLALMTALDVKFDVPTFSACVLVELYRQADGVHYVTMNYRNGVGQNITIERIHLPGCDYKCPIDQFVKITKKRIPTDRAKECHGPSEFFTKKRLQIASAVLFALTSFFFIVIIWMCFRRHCKNKMTKKLKSRSLNGLPNDREEEGANLIT